MSPRRLAPVLAALLVALALPAAASAHHTAATGTIDATLGPANKDGERKMTMTWDVGCSDPDADFRAVAGVALLPKDPKRKPLMRGGFHVEKGSGTKTLTMTPGAKFAPRIDVWCTSYGQEDGEPDHEAYTGTNGPEFFMAPHIGAWHFSNAERCGLRAVRSDRSLQVGFGSSITFDEIEYQAHSLLQRGKGLKGITLRMKGGGRDLRIKPESNIAYAYFYLPAPRRPGKARVWLEFEGIRTNVIKIPILRLPRGCASHATG